MQHRCARALPPGLLLLTLALGACGSGGVGDPEPVDPLPTGWQRVAGVPQQPASEVLLREPQALVVAAGRNLYRSIDGLTWTALPSLPDGVEVASLTVAAGDYWVGTYAERGPFRLPAGDTQWQARSAGLSGLGARTLFGFATRGQQLYAATGGAGVFRRDLGADGAWLPDRDGIPANLSGNVDALTLHQGRMIAGAGGNGALYIQLADAGPWREVTYDSFAGESLQLSAFLDRGAVLLAGGNRKLYRSVDAGESWDAPLSFPRLVNRLRFAPSDDGSIYMMLTTSTETQLLRSPDDGLSWQLLQALPGVQGFDIAILDRILFLAHLGGFWRTSIE